MRFVFTMNMPSKNGGPVHQVFGEHPAESLDELLGIIATEDFLMVREYYMIRGHRDGERSLEPHGSIALNPLFIGKIKELEGDLRE